MKHFPEPVHAILLIGPTGAGKTPLGEHLESKGVRNRRCLHFDFGHQLRTIAQSDSPPEGFQDADHTFIREVLDKGLLLENEHFHIAEKVINLFLGYRNFTDELLVLNGLPRHVDQAGDLDNLVKVKMLIVLECPAGDVHERIRRNTGKDRTGRIDDGIEMIRKKIEIFKKRTAPLIDYYADSGSAVIRLKVASFSSTEEIYNDFISVTREMTL